MQLGSGIGRLNVKGCRGDAVIDGPVYGATEDVFAVVIHAEDKAAVDHDAEGVQAVGDSLVVAAEVLPLVASLEVAGGEGLESDEDAAQACICCTFDEVAAQDGVDGGCTLEEATHSLHAIEECFGKAAVAEKMIVEEIEMTSGQAVDLGECVVDTLGVEAAATLKEGVFVAEVAMLRDIRG